MVRQEGWVAAKSWGAGRPTARLVTTGSRGGPRYPRSARLEVDWIHALEPGDAGPRSVPWFPVVPEGAVCILFLVIQII